MYQVLNDLAEFFREGFAQINPLECLVIAFLASIMISGWSALLPLAVLASIITIVIDDIMIPVFAFGQDFQIPPLTGLEFWRRAIVLLIAYLIFIGIFLFVKRIFVRTP